MTPTIRPAVPDDLPALRQMLDLMTSPRAAGPLRRPGLAAEVFEHRRAELWVAAEPEGLVGCALVLRGPDGPHLVQIETHAWRRPAAIRAALTRAIEAAADAAPLSAGLLEDAAP